MNYLSVENLTHHYGDIRLFDNLNFGVSEGQKIGLIARNGTGKTTLLNILANKMPADNGSVTYRKGIRVGYLSQEPILSNKNTVIEEVFASDSPAVLAIKEYESILASENQDKLGDIIEQIDKLGAWDFEARVKQVLSQLKINNFNQPIEELSGGQKKRVAMAAMLIDEPQFIILDEPTNHLDLDMIEWLENYLKRSKSTILMVTHDRYFLDRVCNSILELDNQTLYAYEGNYNYFLRHREERILSRNLEIEKARNLLRKEQEWINRTPQARSTKAKYRIDAFHELKKTAQNTISNPELNIDVKAARLGKKIIECHNLKKSFGEIKIVNDFSYKFMRGEKVGIIGKNGTGKSTFLNMLMGDIKPDSGVIEHGETVVVGYYRQSGMNIDERKKVIDVISEISDDIKLGGGNSLSPAAFLRKFLFPNEMHNLLVENISGGEKKRLYLMTVLMKNPNFLILDEPTNDLDIFTLNILEEYLQSFNGCVIIVSHDRYFTDNIVDHLFVFEGDGVIRDFPGNYSIYREEILKKQKQVKQEIKNSNTKKVKPVQERKQKLTYKQRLELKQLETDLDSLNEEKTEIENQLIKGSLQPHQYEEKSKRLNEIVNNIEEKELRWFELSEIEE